jgi:deoxycytidylate deaminase
MKQMAMDAAIAVRLESDLKVKVGACLVRGKRIISVAANKSGLYYGPPLYEARTVTLREYQARQVTVDWLNLVGPVSQSWLRLV